MSISWKDYCNIGNPRDSSVSPVYPSHISVSLHLCWFCSSVSSVYVAVVDCLFLSEYQMWNDMLIFFLAVCPAFMPKIKTGRMVQLESLCDFKDAAELQDSTRSATTLYCSFLSSDLIWDYVLSYVARISKNAPVPVSNPPNSLLFEDCP